MEPGTADDKVGMTPEQVSTKLTELIARQQEVLTELLRRAEAACELAVSEGAETVHFILRERVALLQELTALKTEISQLLEQYKTTPQSLSAAVKEMARTGYQTIVQINMLDAQTKTALETIEREKAAALRQLSDGAKLLKSYQTEATSMACSHRP